MSEIERFIISTGRAGSTLLSRMLAENNRILMLSEFLGAVDALNRFPPGPVTGPAFAKSLVDASPGPGTMMAMHSRTLKEFLYSETSERWSSSSDIPTLMRVALPFLTDEPVQLLDDMESFARAAPTQPIDAHYRGLFAWLMQRFERSAWIERTGRNLAFLDEQRRTFPNARYLHVHRDGMEAALSMSEMNAFVLYAEFTERAPTPAELNEALEAPSEQDLIGRLYTTGRPPVEQFGRQWTTLICEAFREFAQMRPEQLCTVAFEALVENPQRELAKIAEFFELPDDPGWIERASALISAPPPARAPGLHAKARERLSAAVRPGQILLDREPSSEMLETYRRIRHAFDAHRPPQSTAAALEQA